MNSRDIWIMTIIKPIILPKIQWKKRKILNSIFILFVILFFHVCHGFFINRLLNIYTICYNFTCKKYVVMFVFWSFCTIFLWYAVVLKRRQVMKMFDFYHSFQRSYNTVFHKLRMILNFTTITCFIAFIGNVVYVTSLVVTDNDLVNKFYDSLRLLQADLFVKKVILMLYIPFTRIVILLIPCMSCLFHIALFSSVLHAINLCKNRAMSVNNKKKVNSFLKMYTKIHEFSASVDSAVSLELLILSSYQCSLIYTKISNLIHSIPLDAVARTQNLFMYLQISLFVVAVFLASEIHNSDVSLKLRMRDVAFQLSLNPENSSCADLLLRFLDSKPVITFTAWKMFNFTRTFFLTSVGALLTYSLLIAQIDI